MLSMVLGIILFCNNILTASKYICREGLKPRPAFDFDLNYRLCHPAGNLVYIPVWASHYDRTKPDERLPGYRQQPRRNVLYLYRNAYFTAGTAGGCW